MKNNPGRPRKGQPRINKITIYLSNAELAAIDAQRGERDRSAYIRELLLRLKSPRE